MTTDGSVRDTRHSDVMLRRVGSDMLASSLARVAALQHELELRTDVPTAGDWWRCHDLLTDRTWFSRWHRRLADWLIEHHGAAPARTVSGYVLWWYLRLPAYVGALLLHHERRVPLLRPSELAFRISRDGRPDPVGVAVLGRSFYCLPLDPCAGRPEAVVVADERALAEMYRARFVAHAAAFVRAYRPLSPHGPRTLWAAATDAIDSCLWWAGVQGGDEGAGVADAALVLDARHEPLTSSSTLRRHTGENGSAGWTRRRESCCFTYLLPGSTECETCPRTCPR
ncbi:(2Fe-2S)-binding protein [Saccharomonospora xinjiangensis]|nr:hypothetical protein EYD13_19680 [Saccharomonospora xinjiangensis]